MAMRVRLKSGKPLFEVRVQEVQGASRMLLFGSHGGVLPELILVNEVLAYGLTKFYNLIYLLLLG